MACILVVPPPIWSVGYEVYNDRLGELQALITEAAEDHGCVVADLFSAYLDAESSLGRGATLEFYRDCPSPGGGPDCVHYSLPRPSLPAEVLDGAILEAISVPEASSWRSGCAALLSVVVVTRWRLKSRQPMDGPE
jgi:hypothetical protein